MKAWWLLCCLLFTCYLGKAQYVSTTMDNGGYYTAMARDKQNNIYEVRYNATDNDYEVAKYINADKNNVQVIYKGLTFDANDLPWGIAVNSHGTVFVLNSFLSGNGQIIRLSPAGPPYSAVVVQSGKYYSAIAIDANDHVWTVEYDGSANYQVVDYNVDASSASGTVVYSNLPTPAGAQSFPWGLAIDSHNNIYVTDFLENNSGGRLIKLTPTIGLPTPIPPYTPTVLSSGKAVVSMGIDGRDVLYTVEGVSSTAAQVVKYKDPTQQGQGVVIFTGLGISYPDYPWGITSDTATGKVYVNDGFHDATTTQALVLTPPTIGINSVTAVNSSPTALATVNYTVTFSNMADNVTPAAFTLVANGPVGANIASITGNNNVYNVAINTGSGDGTLKLNVNGTGITNTIIPPLPYTAGPTYTIDRTAPVGTMQINAGAAYTNSTAVTLTLAYTDADPLLQMRFSNNNTTWSAWENYAATKAWNLPAGDGNKTVYVQVRDRVQNTSLTGQASIILDQTPPAVTSVSVPANKTYTGGDNLTFTVNYGENVIVAGGTPYLNVTIGANTRHANYVSGSGTNALTFTYTIQTDEQALTGISLGSSIVLNGATMQDVATNNAALTLQNVGSTGGVLVNAVVPTVILSTAAVSPLNHAFTVTATFSEAVTGFTAAGFTATNATVSNLTTTDNITYTALITPTADGTVTVQVAAGAAVNSGNNANTASNTLSLAYDATAPVITTVGVPANGYYKAGQVLNFTVNYSENVTVTGTPSLPVVIGSSTVQATYTGGSGSTALTFNYTVQSGDMAMSGISLNNLLLNGGTIKDAATNDAVLTLHGAGNTSQVFVNTSIPSVVLSTTATSPLNHAFTVTATFSEAVTGFTAGGITATNATVSNVATTDNITYTALITPAADGAVTVTVPAAAAVNIGGNNNTVSNTLNLTYDGTAPVVASVGVPANGYYKAGSVLTFSVNLSENVITTGAPYLEVVIGSSTVHAPYVSGSGTSTLTFQYTVQSGDMAMSGIGIGNLVLNGGTIKDAATNDAVLTLHNAGNTSNVFVNTAIPSVVLSSTAASILNQPFTVTVTFSEAVTGFTLAGLTVTNATVSNLSTTNNIVYTVQVTPIADGPVTLSVPANAAVNIGGNHNTASNTLSFTYDHTAPAITSVGVPANGYYKAGQALSFTVNYSENVLVNGGTPSLDVIIGTTTRKATYTGGSGTNALTFTYVVQNGELDLNGITLGASIALNGATMQDDATNNAALTLQNAGNTSGVLVNAVVPTVTLSTTAVSPLNHAFTVTATFSEAVTGFTAAGFTTTNATVSNVATTDHITYTALITPAADGAVTVQVAAGAAVNSGNNANTASNTLSLVYDATAPVIATVGVPANGYYKAGQVLSFTVTFSENVTVTGTPSLPVVIGSSTVQATYTGGSGSTALTFSYTVQSGDMAMSGISLNNLLLNGGTIKDAATNDAVLTLHGAGNTSQVFVNTSIPSVVLSTTAASPLNHAFTVTATFSEAVTGFTAGGITATNATVSNVATTDHITYTALITPTADGAVTVTVPAAAAVNIGGNNNTASNTLNLTYDGTAPVVASVGVPANGYYKAGQSLSFTVNFSENVTVTGTPSLPVVLGISTVQATFTGGSGSSALTFSYTVQSGDMAMSGISLNNLLLNGGTIKDAATNDAVLTLHNTGNTGNVFVNTSIPSVVLSSTAASILNQPFTVTITFSEAVTGITLAGINVANATVSSLSTTNNIVYTVLVTPTADGPVTLSVPANTAVNIGGNHNTASNTLSFTYDHTAPAITSVGVPANGYYKAGQALSFTVNYSENVLVNGGTPSLDVIIGTTTRKATYTGGSGTNALTFTYVVQNGELDLNGITLGASIALNGATMQDDATNNTALTLQNVGNTSGVLVNAVVPTVTLSTTAVSPLNHAFTVTATFSEAVTGLTAAGFTTTNATVSNVATTDHITYTALITPAADGAVTVQVAAGAAINSGNNGNTASNTVSLAYDATAPVITTVGVPANGYYKAGQVLSFTVTFSENVTVTGTPSLPVVIGSSTVQATYTGGSGSTALTFSYTVKSGDMAMSGINLSNLLLNGGTIKDAATNDAVLTLHGTGNTSQVFVNTSIPSVVLSTTATSPLNHAFTVTATFSEAVTGFTAGGITATNATVSNVATTDHITYTALITPTADGAVTVTVPAAAAVNIGSNNNTASNTLNLTYDGTAPVVASVGVPANGYYKAGQSLSFTINFSEKVTVTGTPSLPVVLGTSTVQATYTGGSGSSTLTFSYTVQSGDMAMSGISLNNLLLNGGTIRDAATNDAVLTLHNTGNTGNVFVNTSIPSVVLSSTAASILNQPFTVTITFSEAVTGVTLAGLTVTNATVSNLSTTNNIVYTVLVTPTADGPVTLSVPANTAVNIGGNHNTASNTLSFTYDHTAPAITSVGVPANGYYKAGQALSFTVNYSENVLVNGGTPSLDVIIGTTTRKATYTGGSGTNALTFTYVVQPGELDLNGITLGASIALNGATMQDDATNNAALTLQNAGNTSGVFVNAVVPTVTLSTTAVSPLNHAFTVTVTFSEAVTGFATAGFTTTNATVSNVATTDHITYTALITPAADGTVTIQVPAAVAVNSGNNNNAASNTLSLVYDATAPVITAGQTFDVMDNEAVGKFIGKVTAVEVMGVLQNWTLANDGSNGALAIDASGNITVKDAVKLKSESGTSVTLTVTVSDGLNTSIATPVTIRVLSSFVNKPPVLDPIADVNSCAITDAQTVQLTGASAVEPGQTYHFTIQSDKAFFDVLTVNDAGLITYKLKSSITGGVATITVTIKDNGGTANGGVDTLRRSFAVTVHSLPVVNISSDKGNTISKGDVVLLTATGGVVYAWDQATGIIGDRQQAVLQVRPMVNTSYQVTATNIYGCSSTGKIDLVVNEDFKVDATNLLTPNGDGKNDKWVIRNLDSYPDNEVKIFDRTGRLVYQKRNYNNEWDGTVNGHVLAEGTYYYILTIKGGAKTAKGFITIVTTNNF
ncbi:Ig-like domain-containing protein [Chitinophaga sp. 212800010-3]|uniref:Ig-like domain-containing protein n=1 Tax=unclassified Chitinophaga TaxID=2619133 RepID=UPI002E123C63